MGVFLLLAAVWAVVLVPPALRAHAQRRRDFAVSFGRSSDMCDPVPAGSRSPCIQRRRRIAGGLLVAMVGTLLVGLLPPYRGLLIVHLFLVDSFLAYVATLAHMANRALATSQ